MVIIKYLMMLVRMVGVELVNRVFNSKMIFIKNSRVSFVDSMFRF